MLNIYYWFVATGCTSNWRLGCEFWMSDGICSRWSCPEPDTPNGIRCETLMCPCTICIVYCLFVVNWIFVHIMVSCVNKCIVLNYIEFQSAIARIRLQLLLLLRASTVNRFICKTVDYLFLKLTCTNRSKFPFGRLGWIQLCYMLVALCLQ